MSAWDATQLLGSFDQGKGFDHLRLVLSGSRQSKLFIKIFQSDWSLPFFDNLLPSFTNLLRFQSSYVLVIKRIFVALIDKDELFENLVSQIENRIRVPDLVESELEHSQRLPYFRLACKVHKERTNQPRDHNVNVHACHESRSSTFFIHYEVDHLDEQKKLHRKNDADVNKKIDSLVFCDLVLFSVVLNVVAKRECIIVF